MPLDSTLAQYALAFPVLDALKRRRSVRTYTGERIPDATLDRVLEAGLVSASGRGLRPWEFVLVRERATLDALAASRAHGAGMLAGADAAILVFGRTDVDTWIEDCCIAMANMHLAADALGLGGCWIQGRMREDAAGRPTGDIARELLGVPEGYALEAILSLGVPVEHPAPRELADDVRAKVHRERW